MRTQSLLRQACTQLLLESELLEELPELELELGLLLLSPDALEEAL